MPELPRLAFTASKTDDAQSALQRLQAWYGNCPVDKADVLVALGGDGFMLRTLHRMGRRDLPVYGMKLGSIGFLMNRFDEADLPQRIAAAKAVNLNPLRMEVATESGQSVAALAINEVSLLRQTNQAAHLKVTVNDVVRVPVLITDGILLSTAAGSTAYNLSAYGPILPLGTEALALTPISPYRPRRWRGAILPSSAVVRIDVLDPYKRPVSATADAHEVRNAIQVTIALDRSITHTLLFDPDHSLEERIIAEQFV